MARRPNTSTDSARGNEADPAADNAGDLGASPGVNNSSEAPNGQGADVPAPVKRRKRGPNKPKPGTFIVETQARMQQEEIVKLLIVHATTQLGADVANNMTLQINVDGECRPLGDVLPQGATLQFGTVGATAG